MLFLLSGTMIMWLIFFKLKMQLRVLVEGAAFCNQIELKDSQFVYLRRNLTKLDGAVALSVLFCVTIIEIYIDNLVVVILTCAAGALCLAVCAGFLFREHLKLTGLIRRK
ncbi:hypothetical protein E4M02_13900 [Brevundimonas sp. S30B]|uniref:hypothetical protein n=1 Tax=unclassified Brevundimonas TaxID=2622653 RepID=UPI0010723C18|nr:MULTISPECIES: hypothetical protein [unclassified Brevundimonas]QBX36505.1 hypothetical protein E4M01_01295 [Brevundimonas sp. MF30-B]TFW00618.1 hypothetical protein E4M02_13900 [Brevundimonas sp. S30B]